MAEYFGEQEITKDNVKEVGDFIEIVNTIKTEKAEIKEKMVLSKEAFAELTTEEPRGIDELVSAQIQSVVDKSYDLLVEYGVQQVMFDNFGILLKRKISNTIGRASYIKFMGSDDEYIDGVEPLVMQSLAFFDRIVKDNGTEKQDKKKED